MATGPKGGTEEHRRPTHKKTSWETRLSEPKDYIFVLFLLLALPSFIELLNIAKCITTKGNSNMREAVPVGQRLCITLHSLVIGNAFEDL